MDDFSKDETVEIARKIPGIEVIQHDKNKGYGGNQKTCYAAALERGADIIIMVHPDHQYTPMLIPAMATMIGNGLYNCVLGSRILGGGALKGGMPWRKYIAKPAITWAETVMIGAKISEYHTPY